MPTCPLWVAERLTKESLVDVDGVSREDNFLDEPNALVEFRATDDEEESELVEAATEP